MKNVKATALNLAVIATLATGTVAHAIPTIHITDGITTVTVQDNVGADGSALAGFVSYNAPVGTFAGWSVILSAGVTKPLVGSASAPQLDLNWNVVRSGPGSGNLKIYFSENGFNLAGNTPVIVGAGGTLGTTAANTLNVSSYYDSGNAVLQPTTLLTSHNFSGPGAFSGNDAANAPADPAVAFTVKVDVTMAAGEVTSGDVHLYTAVPEGGSMVTFLGTALLALGFYASRRKA